MYMVAMMLAILNLTLKSNINPPHPEKDNIDGFSFHENTINLALKCWYNADVLNFSV